MNATTQLPDRLKILAAIRPGDERALLASNRQRASSANGTKRATVLFRMLRSALEGTHGRQLCLEELSEMTGEPRSTLCDWFGGSGQPSIEAVLRLAERLPPLQRHQVLDCMPVSRCFPSLEHPRISHDAVAVSSLKTLLRQSSGTTVVQATRADLVTFVTSALGHSYLNIHSGEKTVAGLDVHFPDWFVEVPGVFYLENLHSTKKLQQVLDATLDAIPASAGLILLNGVWPPDLMELIAELAKERHVIIGCSCKLPKERIAIPGPAHVITASQERQTGDRILISIQSV